MNKVDHTRLSKFLSLVLRHKPEEIGLELDSQGWADVQDLLVKMNAKRKNINFETLEDIVATNNKKRFAFNDDKTLIRASQGHSVTIELGYEPKMPPEILYHGTASKNVDGIYELGIKKGSRHHVHLSKDIKTASAVGQRHGKPVIFEIAAQEMHKEGYLFYESENGVWLTEEVPVRFLRKA